MFLPVRGTVFRTTDRRLRASTLATDGTWQVTDLSSGLAAAVGDPTGAIMKRTEGAATFVTSRHIFYVGDDGDVHELRSDAAATSWTHVNITAGIAGVVKSKPGCTPTAYAFQNQGTVHVVYRGTDDRIHE